jgi:septal ring factor EnvC (AmiA/AmiB activator)
LHVEIKDLERTKKAFLDDAKKIKKTINKATQEIKKNEHELKNHQDSIKEKSSIISGDRKQIEDLHADREKYRKT